MRVHDYIVEEVSRQGHDVSKDEGQLRCYWMWRAWETARMNMSGTLVVEDIEVLGRSIEPEKNRDGFRRVGVRVGPRMCPHPNEVMPRLLRLVNHAAGVVNTQDVHERWASAVDWYKEFEMIHPFVDGNGRTGKVLLAWMCRELDDPRFPPHDLFGDWIRNP